MKTVSIILCFLPVLVLVGGIIFVVQLIKRIGK